MVAPWADRCYLVSQLRTVDISIEKVCRKAGNDLERECTLFKCNDFKQQLFVNCRHLH